MHVALSFNFPWLCTVGGCSSIRNSTVFFRNLYSWITETGRLSCFLLASGSLSSWSLLFLFFILIHLEVHTFCRMISKWHTERIHWFAFFQNQMFGIRINFIFIMENFPKLWKSNYMLFMTMNNTENILNDFWKGLMKFNLFYLKFLLTL